jgi:hypothetical protein
MGVEQMYSTITKAEIFGQPERYAWNILLRVKQFEQEELLSVRNYINLPEMIRFQESATMDFLQSEFSNEIDECLEVDWEDCRKWIKDRECKYSLCIVGVNTNVS